MTFYLCDGNDETCKKTGCYKIGGPCKHTSRILYAKNIEKGLSNMKFRKAINDTDVEFEED